ncbi:hypothetical protein [Rhizosaccharibacter radicis]|uniref:Uncharacterized protein n=1 Tax=Rhizosaccharibacter radicis TaxID=2782605 RepID=A0ABT1W2A1_9PROT|nr:hypothetical protein [Acetobacteraceae bacterium KSS12]
MSADSFNKTGSGSADEDAVRRALARLGGRNRPARPPAARSNGASTPAGGNRRHRFAQDGEVRVEYAGRSGGNGSGGNAAAGPGFGGMGPQPAVGERLEGAALGLQMELQRERDRRAALEAEMAALQRRCDEMQARLAHAEFALQQARDRAEVAAAPPEPLAAPALRDVPLIIPRAKRKPAADRRPKRAERFPKQKPVKWW